MGSAAVLRRAGLTANPTGAWTTQATRNLFLRNPDQFDGARALLRDRGSQFIDAFDEVFRAEGFKILRTPVRTPVANTFAERWIGSIRRELLDRTIIWNQRQLERLVVDYIAQYNKHRPHRSSSSDNRKLVTSPHRHRQRRSPHSDRLDATASSTNTRIQRDQRRQSIRAPQAFGVRDVKNEMSRQILDGFDAAGIEVASATYDIVGLPPIEFSDKDPSR